MIIATTGESFTSILGVRDLISFIAGGGLAVYLFKLYRKGNEVQINELKEKLEALEARFTKLNSDYIKEVKKSAAAEAKNEELIRTITRLDKDNKELKAKLDECQQGS
jgi:uncharacterized protein (UPF0335 family)